MATLLQTPYGAKAGQKVHYVSLQQPSLQPTYMTGSSQTASSYVARTPTTFSGTSLGTSSAAIKTVYRQYPASTVANAYEKTGTHRIYSSASTNGSVLQHRQPYNQPTTQCAPQQYESKAPVSSAHGHVPASVTSSVSSTVQTATIRDVAHLIWSNSTNAVADGAAKQVKAQKVEDVDFLEIFCGDCSYDSLRYIKLNQAPDSTIGIDYDQLSTLWRGRAYATRDPSVIADRLRYRNLKREGLLLARVFCDADFAAKTAFSIECCCGVLDMSPTQMQTLREFTFALLEAGANVALADFSLGIADKLFSGRLPRLFSHLYEDVCGQISLLFTPSALTEAPHGQIAALGQLASEGKTTIHAAGSTRRPRLCKEATSFLKVIAVAEGAGQPKGGDWVSIDPQTGSWMRVEGPDDTSDGRLVGTPAIFYVDRESKEYQRSNFKGNILFFAAHFADITEVGGVDENTVFRLMEEFTPIEEVERERLTYTSMGAEARQRYLQTASYTSIVSSRSSIPYPRPRYAGTL